MPVVEEEGVLEELAQDSSSDPLFEVPKICHGSTGLRPKLPLLEVLDGQSVQQVLLALQELQEVEVRLGPSRDDAARSSPEELLALSGPLPEEPDAPPSPCGRTAMARKRFQVMPSVR